LEVDVGVALAGFWSSRQTELEDERKMQRSVSMGKRIVREIEIPSYYWFRDQKY
jgi:hypothetical protein